MTFWGLAAIVWALLAIAEGVRPDPTGWAVQVWMVFYAASLFLEFRASGQIAAERAKRRERRAARRASEEVA